MSTLAQLRTRAQRSADMENHGHIGNAEWLDYINEAQAWVYDILVGANLAYFEGSQTINTDGVDGVYALPADHHQTLPGGVQYQVSTGYWEKLRPISPYDQAIYDVPNGQRAERYRLEGSNLHLFPTPPSGQTYKHLYVPKVTALSADGDNCQIPDRWDEGVVLKTAIMAILKQKSDIRDHLAMLSRWEDRVQKHRLSRMVDALAAPEGDSAGLDPYFRRPRRYPW